MISLFLLIYLLCGLVLYGCIMWAITTALADKAFNGVDGKVVQGLLKMSEKHRNLTMVDKFIFFIMVVLASPIVFIVLTVMKKRGGV